MNEGRAHGISCDDPRTYDDYIALNTEALLWLSAAVLTHEEVKSLRSAEKDVTTFADSSTYPGGRSVRITRGTPFVADFRTPFIVWGLVHFYLVSLQKKGNFGCSLMQMS